MGRFSDSPYFLLEAFFDGLSNTQPIERPILDFDWGVHFVSSFEPSMGVREYGHEKYTNDNTTNGNQEIVWTNYRRTEWNREEYYDPNIVQTFNSYIVSPFINISGRGGGIMSLFIKEPDVGYQQVKVRYTNKDGNTFNFENTGIMDHEPNGEPETYRLNGEDMYFEDHPDDSTPHNPDDLYPADTDKPGDKYLFKFWDTIAKDTFDIFQNDREAYFRKDSLYHDFLKIYAKDMMLEKFGDTEELDIRNYVNTDKLFSYFHNIYKSHDGQKARIIFDGMKDYVMRAVPEHQRTPRFIELCDIFFDQLYQEMFDLLKNIWSLVDPMEVDERYLGYLSQYYDMFDVEVEGASLLQTREFIRDMIWMIKRKGTYTEFYILWRILTGTKNILSVYERWHRKDVEVAFPKWPNGQDGLITVSPPCTATWPNKNIEHYEWADKNTTVPIKEWVDVLYWNKEEYNTPEVDFGAGRGWYKKGYPYVYDGDYIAPDSGHNCPSGSYPPTPMAPSGDLMLSTHYILETDISGEPLARNEILTQTIWETMNRYWEYVRPVNRVSNYRIVEAPITDISGKYIDLYQVTSKSSAFLKTKSGISMDLIEGAYVHNQTKDGERTTWTIHHNLGEYILLQVFDENLDEIIPKEIRYPDGSIVVLEFDTPRTGYALIKKADWVDTRLDPINEPIWKFYHSQLQKEVIVHYKYGPERLYASTSLDDPEEFVPDNTTATFGDLENNTAMVGVGNYIHIQSTPASVWEVDHPTIDIKGMIVAIYEYGIAGEDDVRVHPSRYNLINSNECQVEFDTPISGYAVFVTVGDLSIEDLLEELEILAETVYWYAYEFDEFDNRIEPAVDSGICEPFYKDDDYYYFDVKLTTKPTYIVREIELFDKNGKDEHGDNLLFHSLMSPLYKPPRTDVTFHYRLIAPTEE